MYKRQGCGSGILAITALLLGAKSAVGVDIDELAVKVAQENAERNRVSDKLDLICGDLTEKVEGKYDVICANIVADVIIRMSHDICSFMKSGSILLCSGIIEPREPEAVSYTHLPTAAICIMFATKYDLDAAHASKIMAMTTVLSIITIPLMVFLFQIRR